ICLQQALSGMRRRRPTLKVAVAAHVDVGDIGWRGSQSAGFSTRPTLSRRCAPPGPISSKTMHDIRADDGRVLAVAALLREEVAREAAAGFPTLTRIPSSGVIKLLDHLATLSEADRASLTEAQARLAALHFFPAPLIAKAHEDLRTSDPALLRLQEGLRSP